MNQFLLISDIQACDVDPSSSGAPSYVSSFSAAASGKLDPITGLDRLIDEEHLKPDCILCPGDIANRSNPSALNYTWQRLNALAASRQLRLIATVGNHDVDSRYQGNNHDPRGYLMSLKPLIPAAARDHYLEYWAENYTMISSASCNILVLNTSAYHGSGKDAAAEIEHGRISEITLASIRTTLNNTVSAPVNIALCHHHPISGDQADHELIGQTRGGEKLVQALNDDDSSWIIIHGHKHVPDLYYGQGGGNAPVILACASFSAQVNSDAQNKNPNQVHLLVCDPAAAQAAETTSAGYVKSWTWQPGGGWRRSRGMHGLPHFVGFGYRGNVQTLAEKLDQHLVTRDVTRSTWGDVVAAIPSLHQLVPADLTRFKRAIERKGLVLLSEDDGTLAEIGRKS